MTTCPECSEQAQPAPPDTILSYASHGIAVPAWSHLDGEPLCPVMGPGGYEPATPVEEDE